MRNSEKAGPSDIGKKGLISKSQQVALREAVSSPLFGCSKFGHRTKSTSTEDRFSQARIIAKFFGGISDRSAEAAYGRMGREFNNLNHLRSLGFAGYPHYIARPLGCNGNLNFLLAEEYC
jgi:hypothetical protein